MAWPVICLTCWTCLGAPAWPERGEPNAAWVASALQWRSWTGMEDCPERTEAIDALTLQWVSESSVVVVRVETEEWPELRVAPGLARPLVQMMALEQMRNPDHMKMRRVQRRLRRMARRSDGLWRPDLRTAFQAHRASMRSSDDKAADGTGEHQQGQGG